MAELLTFFSILFGVQVFIAARFWDTLEVMRQRFVEEPEALSEDTNYQYVKRGLINKALFALFLLLTMTLTAYAGFRQLSTQSLSPLMKSVLALTAIIVYYPFLAKFVNLGAVIWTARNSSPEEVMQKQLGK